jgi:uncharacterized membrane protein HdeD (DUF308 family)
MCLKGNFMKNDVTNRWGMMVLSGVFSLLLGLVVIISPTKTLGMFAWLTGLFLLIEGVIFSLIALFSIKKYADWGALLLRGVVTLLLGLVIFANPQLSIGVLYFLMAIWVLIGSITMLVEAFHQRKELMGAQWLLVAGGIIGLMFAMLLFSQPTAVITVSMVLFGVLMLLSGIFSIALGLQTRQMEKLLKASVA